MTLSDRQLLVRP